MSSTPTNPTKEITLGISREKEIAEWREELASTTNPEREKELKTLISLNAPRFEHSHGRWVVRQRYDVWEIPQEGKLSEQFLKLTDEKEKMKFIIDNATRKWEIGADIDDSIW